MAQRALLSSKDQAYQKYLKAHEAFKAGKLDKALTIANNIISTDSAFLKAFTLRGWLYHLKKDNTSALTDLNHFLTQFSESEDALISRGRVYLAQKEYTLAMTDFIAAIRAARNNFSSIDRLEMIACKRIFELFEHTENKEYEAMFLALFPKANGIRDWKKELRALSEKNLYFLFFLWLYDNELLERMNLSQIKTFIDRKVNPESSPYNKKKFYRELEDFFNTPCAQKIKDIEAYLKKLRVAQEEQRAPHPLPPNFSLAFLIKHFEFKDYADCLPSLIQLGTTKDVFFRQVPVLTVLLILAAQNNNHLAIELLIKTGASTLMPRRFDRTDSDSPFQYANLSSIALMFCLANDIPPEIIDSVKKHKDKIINKIATLPTRILDPALEKYQDEKNPSPLRQLVYAARGASVFGLFIIPWTDTECTDNSDAAKKMAALIESRKTETREVEKKETSPDEGKELVTFTTTSLSS